MESGIANYLHKKFKKQLSIEPKLQHDKENKDSRTIEPREEKTECVSDRLLNDSVPNQSTNPNSPPVLNASSSSTNCKSSNSIENCVGNIPSSNSHISYLVCNNINNDSGQYDQNIFDTKPYTFSSIEATNTLVNSTSSIFNNVVYTKREDSPVEEVQDYSMKNDTSDVRVECREEVPPPAPDRTSGGKYVCTYCNLVCSKPSVLQKHIRAHTNERPYPCISCGFSFKTRSNLYKHCRSRTHANRVMGNKAQEGNNEPEVCKSIEPQFDISGNSDDQISVQDLKNKPYKPRFHTVNTDKVSRDYIDEEKERLMQQHANSDILSHHINEIINKNNSIVNSNESSLYKRRMSEMNVDNNNDYGSRLNRSDALYISTSVDPRGSTDEPLNLTKNRKRSISEVAEPVVQKSLIKELLLKNLSSDMQCKYCKMIFQTVTELELHKLRSCKGKPADSKYSRSTSVNVASILTKNKNAFDSIPQLQNTVFPLNSPGPFLGRTRLVDGDKSKSFSFDSGNLPLSSPSSEPAGTPYYLLSPISFEREKKTPVRMFGGEVKVHTSGETKSYRVADGDDNYNKEHGFLEYGGKLSENRVVKSSLQSGGTVLTNKTNYRKHESKTPQEVIKVYENTLISPSIDISNIRRFNFDQNQKDRTSNSTEVSSIQSNSADLLLVSPKICNIPSPLGKYPNMMDFSQKAVKLLTPNLKQPYLSVSGFANRFIFDNLSDTKPQLSLQPAVDRRIEPLGLKRYSPNLKKELEERSVISKNSLPQKEGDKSPATPIDNIYNPMSLLVNGKVVRYVPGIPGPVVAGEGPAEPAAYVSNIIAVPTRKPTKQLPSPIPTVVVNEPPPSEEGEVFKLSKTFLQKIKKPIMDRMYKMPKLGGLEVKTDGISIDTNEMRSPSKISDLRSPNNTVTTSVEQKKFARPNSLALKPTTASLKQHHGLTPTLFNQILISPDTPRVAKKYAQHFLHGNYFSYLGLKSSTKPVYCTLNKTQPFYVPHFKKLSMYSEWRQQDTKTDKLYVSAYDSRQKSQNYTTAGKTTADLIIHSSYKFVISEVPSNKTDKNQEDQRPSVLGGYECNDDYTYIRGRGRGRYVCDQCGIRCKKPSMLKKHIRTHSNDRPYTCSHCNFSFKTKGNLTKHMKSKAHTKNYAASSGSGSSTQLSGTQSSESDTDDSGMDSSDESTTRQQEHEAAYGLLSLSQKTTQAGHHNPLSNKHSQSIIGGNNSVGSSDMFMTNEEINHVSKTNYAKNKILDQASSYTKKLSEITPVNMDCEESPSESQNICSFLGKTSATRPLTYPYTSVLTAEDDNKNSETLTEKDQFIKNDSLNVNADNNQHKSIKQFHVIQKYALPMQEPKGKSPMIEYKNISSSISKVPTLKVNDVVVQENNERKRKFSVIENTFKPKTQKSDEVMDLSMTTDKNLKINGTITGNIEKLKKYSNESYLQSSNIVKPAQSYTIDSDSTYNNKMEEINNLKNLEFDTKDLHKSNGSVLLLKPVQVEEQTYSDKEEPISSNERRNCTEYDNSAMETLAEVATKQVKLEKNTLAKSVASEFLKLATKNENIDADRESSNYIPINKDVNELIVKPEGNKSCTICSKTFSRPSQLRLHMNIHYLERPFRCDSCSVSFRTKGHLQKHERSASHHSKLSSSPAQASSEPRPFKCSDCNIAFRIHGHLAKHLRSKMHIMKLECLAKIPFGLYAELERSNSLLTEINTCDADQCLESLKTLADKVLINDPSKLQTLGINQPVDVRGITDTDS